jgi:hypothetical protein
MYALLPKRLSLFVKLLISCMSGSTQRRATKQKRKPVTVKPGTRHARDMLTSLLLTRLARARTRPRVPCQQANTLKACPPPFLVISSSHSSHSHFSLSTHSNTLISLSNGVP